MDNSSGQIWFLNRGLVILRPKEPFIQWASQADPGGSASANEFAQPSTYLIPEYESEEESWNWIQDNSSLLFEVALSEWDADEAVWPAVRDWAALDEWFQVEFVELVWDLVDEPLTSDPEAPEHQMD